MATPPDLHVTNRQAFLSMDSTDAAFTCYCKLVALELTFKDTDPALYSLSHDVINMAQTMFTGNANVTAAATAMAVAMGKLYCTGRNRKTKQRETSLVSPSVYPDLRYIRRQADFAGSATTESDLTTFQSKLDLLIATLAAEGLRL